MTRTPIPSLCALAAGAIATRALCAPAPGPEAFLALAVSQTLVGHCRIRLTPDTVVLRGSLTVDTLKAEQAAEQIGRQLTAIRAAVCEAGGTLVALGRSREIDPQAVAALLAQGEGKPFHSVQSIEILLPDETGLDRLIDRLLVLGMGAPIPAGTSGRRPGPQPLVSYRVSDPGAQIVAMYQACRQDAVSRWCLQRVSRANRGGCEEALNGFAHYLRDGGISLLSAPPVAGIPGDIPARPGLQPDQTVSQPLDLPTSGPIEIQGQVTLRVEVPDL